MLGLCICLMTPIALFTAFCFWQASGLIVSLLLLGLLVASLVTGNIAVALIASVALYYKWRQ